MIKYIGSKRALLDHILSAIRQTCRPGSTVADVFSGTSRVGHALKGAGYRVIANDHNAYAHVLAQCYVQVDAQDWSQPAQRLLAELSQLPGRAGYFTDTFCVRSRYFQPKNGERVDAIRERIEILDLPPELRAIMLVSLMEAADRVDSTAGLQMAYMKQWAARANNDIQLRMPKILPRTAAGKCMALCGDAEIISQEIACDLAYLDPPYNQHSYLNNYHVWESLVRWDKPEVYGIACKRIDCRERKSSFNSRPNILRALERTITNIKTDLFVISFNNEGYIPRADMEAMLERFGEVETIELVHDRYVGAKIGIYNPDGVKVGAVGHLKNKEFLYILSKKSKIILDANRVKNTRILQMQLL